MAKASEADLRMAIGLDGILNALQSGQMPQVRDKDPEEFDPDRAADCVKALRLILDELDKGNLSRVIWGMATVCDPANEIINPAVDHLELNPK